MDDQEKKDMEMSPPKRRGIITTGTIVTTLIVAALLEVFKATINFLWGLLLTKFWKKKQEEAEKEQKKSQWN